MSSQVAFVRPRPVAHPTLRLIIFHHAGGAASAYHAMAAALPADWDVVLLELPGRGKRSAEAALDSLPALLPRVLADVAPLLDAPVALFGHSLGAILASEVARACEQRGTPALWLGISGRIAPRLQHLAPRLSAMSDDTLLSELFALGGTPTRAQQVPELRARLLRIVRADIGLLETFAPSADRAPLSCPITTFAGTADIWAPPSQMEPWTHETVGATRARHYPGGHFFFLEATCGLAHFARDIAAEIQNVCFRRAA